MHNAPPVVFPVGRFVGGVLVMASLAVLGAIGLTLWQGMAGLAGSVMGWAWGTWCFCVVVAVVWTPGHALTNGRLFWTGEVWFLQTAQSKGEDATQLAASESQEVQVLVLLDLGCVMLLTLQPLDDTGQRAGRLRHAWVQQLSMPSKWHGFRCAVYSRPKVISDAAASSS